MDVSKLFIAYYTIIRKEVIRGFRLWAQNFLPSAVTSVMYFLIFGSFLGSRIGTIHSVPFISFVIPGLIMLAVVTTSFTHVAFIFFIAKFFGRNIDEILASPTPPWLIIAAFVSSGIIRGMLIALMVFASSLPFAPLAVHSVWATLLFLVMTSMIFSLAGLANGVFAKNFDSINIVPTFVLTPLVYLGGVFYSIQALPPFWQQFSVWNPVFYLINGLRYGLLGISDVSLARSVMVLLTLAVALASVNWYLIRKGLGLKQ